MGLGPPSVLRVRRYGARFTLPSLRIVERHPDLTEARLDLITQIKRLGGAERMNQITEMGRLRAGV